MWCDRRHPHPRWKLATRGELRALIKCVFRRLFRGRFCVVALRISAQRSPGRLKRQNTICSSTIPPPAASANRLRGLSYASANTPAMNVTRNGIAQSQGPPCAPVRTSDIRSSEQSNGVLLPKNLERRSPRYNTSDAPVAMVMPALLSVPKKRRAGSIENHINPAAERKM